MKTDRLTRLREHMGVTQVQMAQDLGIGDQQIWRYENGKTTPDGDTVAMIARYLNTSADYLLGLTDLIAPYNFDEDLSEKERVALHAWRRGERLEAIKVIAGDE